MILPVSNLTARTLALLALCAIVFYPIPAFLSLESLPVAVRAAWILIPLAAWIWPWWSLLGFLVIAPLVPTLPTWFGWPLIAPAEILLFGILIPALLRHVTRGFRLPPSRAKRASARLAVAFGGGGQAEDGAAGVGSRDSHAARPTLVLAAIATSSVIVVLYPLHLATDGIGPLLRQIHDFARTDLIVAQSQNHLFGSLTAWAMLIEGLALLWMVLELTRDSPQSAQRPQRKHVNFSVLSVFSVVKSRPDHGIETSIAQLVTAAATGATIVAALGVAQWWTGHGLLPFWLQQNPHITRINATFTDVNGLGSYLAMMAPIVLGLSMRRVGLWRRSWRAAAVLLMLALLFTASRSAWVALAIGLVVYALAIWRLRLLRNETWISRHAPRVMAGATAVLVLSVGMLSVYATARDVRYYDEDSYFETVLYTLNLRAPAQERLKGRLAFWSAAGAMIAERPLFGIGLGRFFKDVAVYAPDPAALPRPRENAHNYFLQIAAEVGLIGLTALGVVLLAAILGSSRVAASQGEACHTRHVALAVPLAIVVYLLTWTTGHPLLVREGQFAFWPLVGVAFVVGERVQGSGVPRLRCSWAPGFLIRTSRTKEPRNFGTPASWLFWLALALVTASTPFRAAREERRVDLTRLSFGLHDRETDSGGRDFQWTHERAVFHFPAAARVFSFELRSIAPFDQTVTVLLDGTAADRLKLVDHAWHPQRYSVPQRQGTRRYHRVELIVSPVMRPPNDPRALGVQLRGVGWVQ